MTSNDEPAALSSERTTHPSSLTRPEASAHTYSTATKSQGAVVWTAALSMLALALTLFIVWITQPAFEHGLWWVIAFLCIGAVGLWSSAIRLWFS